MSSNVTTSTLIKQEATSRVNVTVEERAGFSWIAKMYRAQIPNAAVSRSTSVERSPENPTQTDGNVSSTSSSVDSDEEADAPADSQIPPQSAGRGTVALGGTLLPPIPTPAARQPFDDDPKTLRMQQQEWQLFEDKARMLRRLVEGERDTEALVQLQKLKKPKTSRLKKSDLPAAMVAERYMRAERTTTQEVPSLPPVVPPQSEAQSVMFSREQAARKRRLQQLQGESKLPHGLEGKWSDALDGPPPFAVDAGRAARSSKLPSLQPLPASKLTTSSAPQSSVVDDGAVPQSRDQIETSSVAQSTSASVSPYGSPQRAEEARGLVTNVIDHVVVELQTVEHMQAMDEVRRHLERIRRECSYLEEQERVIRADVADDEAETRRGIQRQELMMNTSIIRRARESAAAEREAAFRLELQHLEERRQLDHEERRTRGEIHASEEKSKWELESVSFEIFEIASRLVLTAFEHEERLTVTESELSERKLCRRLLEEKRVREEAERRIRRFAERRAAEERERLFAEKIRGDIKEQLAFLASEVSSRHQVESSESAAYVHLVRCQGDLKDLLARIREENLKREAEERVALERENLRIKLANEHAERRDFILDEDQSRTALMKEETAAALDLKREGLTSRQLAHGKYLHRLATDHIADELRKRDILESEQMMSWSRLEGSQRLEIISVMEKTKLREAQEARKAFEEADRLLKEALLAKQDAAQRLRSETERIEAERDARRREQDLIQLQSQVNLLVGEETLHRQLLVSSASSERETMLQREETSRDIIHQRLQAEMERRRESEASMAKLRESTEGEQRRWMDTMEKERLRMIEEVRKASSEASPQRATSREGSVQRNRDSVLVSDPQMRFIELQLAEKRAEEEIRLKKLEDEAEQRQRQVELIADAIGELQLSEASGRSNLGSLELVSRDKMQRMRDLSKRAALDREQLRRMENGEEESVDIQHQLRTLSAAVSAQPQTTKVMVLVSEEWTALESVETHRRSDLINEAMSTFGRLASQFRDQCIKLEKIRLETEKEFLAAVNPDVAALLAHERAKQQKEQLNAIYAALFAVVRSEFEGREMLAETEKRSRYSQYAEFEHDRVVAKAKEAKRIAKDEELRRQLHLELEAEEKRQQETALIFAKQQVGFAKDEVIQRQVLELAEQANFDAIVSRGMHARVVAEQQEAARVRQVEREAEQQALAKARLDFMIRQVNSDESHERQTISSDEFTARRYISDWALQQETQTREREALRTADEIRLNSRASELEAKRQQQISAWERIVKEKEQALMRATAHALEKRPPSTPSATMYETASSVSPPRAERTTTVNERAASPKPSSSHHIGPMPLSFSESDIRMACAKLDNQTLLLFYREETFMRTQLGGCEHSIRRDILREERHLRRRLRLPSNSGGSDGGSSLSTLQQHLNSVVSQEAYLRTAIESEEQRSLLHLLQSGREASLIGQAADVSPLRKRVTADRQSRSGYSAWFAASMEVVFQEEYYRREQIIAEYNRGKLTDMIVPFEYEIAIVQLVSDEMAVRRQVEAEEATVVTKFIRRAKRWFKMVETLSQNCATQRDTLMDEYKQRVASLSLEDLYMLLAAAPIRPSSVPSVDQLQFPSRFSTGTDGEDEQQQQQSASSDVHSIHAYNSAYYQVPGIKPAGPLKPKVETVWKVDDQIASDTEEAATLAPIRQATPAWDERSPSKSPSLPWKRRTPDQYREAIIDLEIEHARSHKDLSYRFTTTLGEYHRAARYLVHFFQTCSAALLQVHDTFSRRTEALENELKRTRILTALEESSRSRSRVQSIELGMRQHIRTVEDGAWKLLTAVDAHLKDAVSAFVKAKRTRLVLYDAVSGEVFQVTRTVKEQQVARLIAELERTEEQRRHAIIIDEIQLGKGVRRQIIEMLEMKSKVDVELIVQQRNLLVHREVEDRQQIVLEHDLLMRLTVRFLRLQQAVGDASVSFFNGKQTWCLNQCLAVQDVLLANAGKIQAQRMMVLTALINRESVERSMLYEEEDVEWKLASRFDRFCNAIDSFSDKCLAAKITFVERLAPGLPPPLSVSVFRLPKLKSVIQRSQSMALVMNKANNDDASPIMRSMSLSSRISPDNSASPDDVNRPSTTEGVRMSTPSAVLAGAPSGKSFRAGPTEGDMTRFSLEGSRSFIATPTPQSNRRTTTTFALEHSPQFERSGVENFDLSPEKSSGKASPATATLPPKVATMLSLLRSNDSALVELDLSSLSSNVLTPTLVQTIAELCSNNTNVQMANFSGVKHFTEDPSSFIEPLARIANRIGAIDLSSCDLVDNFIAALCDKFVIAEFGTNVQKIVLDDNPRLTNVAVTHIARFARVNHSICHTCSTVGIPAITVMHQRWLGFYLDLNKQHKQFKAVILAVEAKQTIPRLNFCIPRRQASSANLRGIDAMFRREFDDRSVRLACISISNNDTVEALSFRGNRVTDKGVKLLVNLLQRNTTLRELDLSYNEITDVGAQSFLQLLEGGNSTLLHLDLTENKGITDVNIVKKISVALQANLARNAKN